MQPNSTHLPPRIFHCPLHLHPVIQKVFSTRGRGRRARMSFSKVPDGAFTPDRGRGVEPRGSTGMGVLSLGYVAGGMGQLRDERGQVVPSYKRVFPMHPRPTRQTGSLGCS